MQHLDLVVTSVVFQISYSLLFTATVTVTVTVNTDNNLDITGNSHGSSAQTYDRSWLIAFSVFAKIQLSWLARSPCCLQRPRSDSEIQAPEAVHVRVIGSDFSRKDMNFKKQGYHNAIDSETCKADILGSYPDY
jgi:hypothetical protein